MLNTYITRVEGPRFPDKILVENKRAPTDDSIRLAEELREKITRSIVLTEATDNPLHGNIVILDAPEKRGLRVCVGFTLNGRQHYETAEVDCIDLAMARDRAATLVVEAAHKAVTHCLLPTIGPIQ